MMNMRNWISGKWAKFASRRHSVNLVSSEVIGTFAEDGKDLVAGLRC